MKFELELSQRFQKKYISYTKKNSTLEKKFDSFFHKLKNNPFQSTLKTHKIYSSDFGEVFSSSVTGDLRVLWIQQNNSFILLLLDTGGHSVNKNIYK